MTTRAESLDHKPMIEGWAFKDERGSETCTKNEV